LEEIRKEEQEKTEKQSMRQHEQMEAAEVEEQRVNLNRERKDFWRASRFLRETRKKEAPPIGCFEQQKP